MAVESVQCNVVDTTIKKDEHRNQRSASAKRDTPVRRCGGAIRVGALVPSLWLISMTHQCGGATRIRVGALVPSLLEAAAAAAELHQSVVQHLPVQQQQHCLHSA